MGSHKEVCTKVQREVFFFEDFLQVAVLLLLPVFRQG